MQEQSQALPHVLQGQSIPQPVLMPNQPLPSPMAHTSHHHMLNKQTQPRLREEPGLSA